MIEILTTKFFAIINHCHLPQPSTKTRREHQRTEPGRRVHAKSIEHQKPRGCCQRLEPREAITIWDVRNALVLMDKKTT